MGPGRAGGWTLRLHSPVTLASTSARPRGGRAQRCSEQLRGKVLKPVPPPREEGELEEQPCQSSSALKCDPARGTSLGPTSPCPTYICAEPRAGTGDRGWHGPPGVPAGGEAEAPRHGQEHVHALAAAAGVPPLGGGHDRPLRGLRALRRRGRCTLGGGETGDEPDQ